MKKDTAPSRPRGRPRGFDRDAALEQALQLFWRRGYEGTSIADLTEELGITAPSLYSAFTSKAELYREALARYRAQEGALAARTLAEEPTFQAAVSRMLRESAHEFTRPGRPGGCMVSTAVLGCASENEEVARHVASLRGDTLRVLRERVEQAISEGELPADTDAEALARFIGAVVQGMSVQARDGADEAALLAIVETALKAIDASTGASRKRKKS
ncbi:TetR/AcrR family transcriptional regulator [Hyalangium gracile]|uniref:TetR/AcrR family transcriptional regulator n=1 Tax=Hyalangium gracile TaxID=394092 RepID=UPI001CCB3B5A|nr:TetR/AcrR family transcriptional regulator [Hyalangium gracile]